jgi:agmatine deiminase
MNPAKPRELGFRMPAEWEPHAATWIAWPHNREDWPGRFAPIPWVYCEIVRKLSQSEAVRILIQSEEAISRVKRMLVKSGADLSTVQFFPIPTDRVWTRDYAPLFVKSNDGEVAITNWNFNAWAKYDDWHHDNAVNEALIRQLGMRSWSPNVVLEGGSIDVNGAGILMTTEECLLSPVQARNPHLTRAEIERVLSDYLGIDRVVWLKNGIAGDDTHGHIDDLARFVNANTIVIAQEGNRDDANYLNLAENFELLQSEGFDLVSIPMPAEHTFNRRRLPASYANFYIANETVLVPTFNDPNDRIAVGIIGDLFPDREVVGIHAVELVWGLGTLHCMTQQEPARETSASALE